MGLKESMKKKGSLSLFSRQERSGLRNRKCRQPGLIEELNMRVSLAQKKDVGRSPSGLPGLNHMLIVYRKNHSAP